MQTLPVPFSPRGLIVALVLTAAVAATGLPVQAQPAATAGAAEATAVVVVVKVPTPWYAPRALVVGKMRETIPQYEKLPGLVYKAFSLARADGQFGGIYLWQDRASAEAWFSPAWFARVDKERGAKGEVRYFDAPVVLDNTPGGTPMSAESSAVSTIVTIPIPAGVDRDRLVAEFRAAVPQYRKVAGLLRKYFIVTDDGKFGGVYLWSDQAAAERWFSAAWHERVVKTYGVDAGIEWFDIPILLPGRNAGNGIALARP